MVDIAEISLCDIEFEICHTLVECDCEQDEQDKNWQHDNCACHRSYIAYWIKFDVANETNLDKEQKYANHCGTYPCQFNELVELLVRKYDVQLGVHQVQTRSHVVVFGLF